MDDKLLSQKLQEQQETIDLLVRAVRYLQQHHDEERDSLNYLFEIFYKQHPPHPPIVIKDFASWLRSQQTPESDEFWMTEGQLADLMEEKFAGTDSMPGLELADWVCEVSEALYDGLLFAAYEEYREKNRPN